MFFACVSDCTASGQRQERPERLQAAVKWTLQASDHQETKRTGAGHSARTETSAQDHLRLLIVCR